MLKKALKQNKEEDAIVLDFLPNGYPFDKRPSHRKNPIVQSLGKDHFTLLELVPKKGVSLQPHEEVYIGEGKREKIHHITGKLPIDKLTRKSKQNLKKVVNIMVNSNEKTIVNFLNNSKNITRRIHQLRLLPGLNKNLMWEIIEERKVRPFKNLKDYQNRIKIKFNIIYSIIKRILRELEGKENHLLFVGNLEFSFKDFDPNKESYLSKKNNFKKLKQVGLLGKYGYSTNNKIHERQFSLEDAIENEGKIRVLNFMNWRIKMERGGGHDSAADTLEKDIEWVKKKI